MFDRHGKLRHYLRRPGFPRAALPGLYGSEEFAEAYRLAMGGAPHCEPPPVEGIVGHNDTKAGTIMATKRERYERYETLLDKLDMTQVGAARFFDVGERTSRRWASGEIEVPLAVIMLLELLVKTGTSPHDVRELAGVPDRRTAYNDKRRS